MGKNVNVVTWDGRVVSVSEEDAAALQNAQTGARESAGGETLRAQTQLRHEQYSGAGNAIKAGAEGALDTLTFGGYGAFLGGEGYEARAQEHPYARTAGAVAGLLVPGAELAAPGIAARAGEAVNAATGSRVLGRAIEGSMFGAGAHVANSAVTGDPLTIEGTLEDAGIGALLNVGFGAAADRLTGAGKRAQEALNKTTSIEGHVATVKEGRELFNNPPDSWQTFQDAVEGRADAQNQAFKEAKKANDTYAKFVGSPQKMGSAVKETEAAINTVSRYWKGEGVPDTLLNTEGETLTPAAGSEGRKAPISDEMKARLKDFRDRIRRVDQLRVGGWDVDATQQADRWVKDPSIPPDPARAAEELRKLQDDLRQQFPKAGRGLKDLPAKPPDMATIAPPVKADLPDSLLDFARKRPESINRIANLIAGDQAATEALQKVGGELGLGVEDGVAGLHRGLGKYMDAEAALKKYAEDKATADSEGGILAFMRRNLKKFARYGAARATDTALGGGLIGAAGRVFGGEAAGMVMGAAEDTILGGALLQGRQGITAKVQQLVAKWAVPTAKGVERLGPISAYLTNSFPSGERDKERDPRKLAANRTTELMHAQMTAPDNMFMALQPMMGHSSDAAWKIHNAVLGALNHLTMTAPKDPSTPTLLHSEWLPTLEETQALAHRMEAVLNPLDAIARTIQGGGHPAAAETLWTVWPNMMAAVTRELAVRPDLLTKLKLQQGAGHSELLGAPLTGLQDPSFALAMQQLYQPPPAEPQRASRRTGNPTGRPAAVQSPVANTSVANLIS